MNVNDYFPWAITRLRQQLHAQAVESGNTLVVVTDKTLSMTSLLCAELRDLLAVTGYDGEPTELYVMYMYLDFIKLAYIDWLVESGFVRGWLTPDEVRALIEYDPMGGRKRPNSAKPSPVSGWRNR